MRNVMHEKSLYGNNEVYYDDVLLFYTSNRKINWYFKRGLIECIEDNKYKFLFRPKGFDCIIKRQHPPILIENKCVQCGATNNLTKHHIVPFSYRRYMPDEYKTHNPYDIMILCVKCHSDYEKVADILKSELSVQYNVPEVDMVDGYPQNYKTLQKIRSILSIYNNNDIIIPQDKREKMKMELLEFFGYIPVGKNCENILNELSPKTLSKKIIPHYKLLMDKIENLDNFVYMWRKHFIDNTDCKYLPKYWNIENKKVY